LPDPEGAEKMTTFLLIKEMLTYKFINLFINLRGFREQRKT